MRARAAAGRVVAARAQAGDDLVVGGEERLAGVDHEFGDAVAEWAGRGVGHRLVDEVGKREEGAVGVEEGDVEIFRGHEAGDDAVHAAEERGEIIAAENGLRNFIDAGLHLFAAAAFGDVDADGQHARLAAELDNVGIEEERADETGAAFELGFEIADGAGGAEAADKLVTLVGVEPEAELERGAADHLSRG